VKPLRAQQDKVQGLPSEIYPQLLTVMLVRLEPSHKLILRRALPQGALQDKVQVLPLLIHMQLLTVVLVRLEPSQEQILRRALP